MNLSAARGVAVREFVMKPPGRADYLLFLDGRAVGVVEAKKEGDAHGRRAPEREVRGRAPG